MFFFLNPKNPKLKTYVLFSNGLSPPFCSTLSAHQGNVVLTLVASAVHVWTHYKKNPKYYVTVCVRVGVGVWPSVASLSNSVPWLFVARRGWFPSSYCRPHVDSLILNRWETFQHLRPHRFFSQLISDTLYPLLCLCSNLSTPVRRLSAVSLPEEDDDEPVLLPPPDYSDDTPPSPLISSTPTPQNMVSSSAWFTK